ncbi:hypothetical protein CDIK_4340 [Cucumispora dikerogammari]|nr:hypothetical protein CDIK_4340 [Cucumispora dikerogammari]
MERYNIRDSQEMLEQNRIIKDETCASVNFRIDDYSNLCSHLNIIDLAYENKNISLKLSETEKICQIDISELVKKNLECSNETGLNIIHHDIKVAPEVRLL